MLAFIASCSMRKHIPDDKMILKHNIVEIETNDVAFTKSDITPYISQTSNPKFLGMMPLTWIYYKTENKTDKKFFNWINKTIGKKPVYFSDELKDKSKSQIEKYLNDIGYFNSKIYTQIKNNRGIGSVTYDIYPTTPYIIDEITYNINDSSIYNYVKNIENELPVQKGDIYNAFDLDDERDMITEYLKNNGYYYFTKDYIFMEIDTNFSAHKANVNIRIDNAIDPLTLKNENHKKYPFFS